MRRPREPNEQKMLFWPHVASAEEVDGSTRSWGCGKPVDNLVASWQLGSPGKFPRPVVQAVVPGKNKLSAIRAGRAGSANRRSHQQGN